jgi:hypothetical protein
MSSSVLILAGRIYPVKFWGNVGEMRVGLRQSLCGEATKCGGLRGRIVS